MNRNDRLIQRKFNSYLIPGVMMSVALQAGNIIDCILVSRLIDLDGLTAISLSYPVLVLIQLTGLTLGAGSAAVISVMLGRRQMEEASEVFSAVILAAIGISLVFSALSFIIIRPLASFLTPSPVLAGMLADYMFVFMLLCPILNLYFLISNVITVDNSPKLGAAGAIIYNVANLSSEFVFLKFLNMGMKGAALSTILGAAVALFLLIPYSRSEKRMLKPGLKKALSGIRQVGQVFKAGAAKAALYAMTILQFFTLNTIIQNTLGPDYLAIYAVCMNSVTIVRLFAEGVIGLIQNIAGVLYGEKDYFGVRALVKRTAVTVVITSVFLMGFFVVFPKSMLILFSFNKMDIYDTALQCVRLFSLSFIFFAANRMTQVYYQSTLQTGLSTLNTVLQGFVLLLPCVCLLMHFAGIKGVCVGVAVTETLTFLTVWVYRMIRQKQGKLPQKGFLMIPDQDSDVLFDTTVSSTTGDAAKVIRELSDCCNKNGIQGTPAKTVCMTAEALIDNISRYGYNIDDPCAVDICLSRNGDSLILRIRDDGVPFDPSVYGKEDADIFESSSIEIIKRVTSAISYTRVLNMNNTVIEVSL